MENKNNNLIYGIIIGLLLAVVCFLVINIFSTKNTKSEPQNNSQNQSNQQTTQPEKINYEIVENNGSYSLNVNGKNTNISLPNNDLSQITQLDDVVIAKVCTTTCNVYAIDKESNIIAATKETANASILSTKGTNITGSRVVGNELYITSQNVMLNSDAQSVCENLQNAKNSDVKFEEKYTYNNGKFGQATTVKSVSADEFAKENNINCNN